MEEIFVIIIVIVIFAVSVIWGEGVSRQYRGNWSDGMLPICSVIVIVDSVVWSK